MLRLLRRFFPAFIAASKNPKVASFSLACAAFLYWFVENLRTVQNRNAEFVAVMETVCFSNSTIQCLFTMLLSSGQPGKTHHAGCGADCDDVVKLVRIYTAKTLA